MLPLLMFSSFYCYFFLQRPWQQWTVFFSAFAFAIVGNVTRILLLVVGSVLWGMSFAVGTNDEPSRFHEAAGFAVFVVALGLECLFGLFLMRAETWWKKAPASTAPPAPAPAHSIPASAPAVIPLWRSGLIASLAAAMFAVCTFSPPVYLPSEAGVLMNLPDHLIVPGIADGGDFIGHERPSRKRSIASCRRTPNLPAAATTTFIRTRSSFRSC